MTDRSDVRRLPLRRRARPWAFGLLALVAVLAARDASAQPPKSKKTIDREAVAREVRDAHNRERAAQKLAPLTLDPKLNRAAERHAADMAEHRKMTHDGSDGSKPAERIKREDYRFQAAGENVAYGLRTVADVMKIWMESPHHRDNILGEYTQLGVGEVFDEKGVPYWCVDFGTPWTRLEPGDASSDLVSEINEARAAEAKPALAANLKLAEAAQTIAAALAKGDTLDFAKADGSDLNAALKPTGYRYRSLALAAAAGQGAAKGVVATWMASPPHKTNVLGDFTEVGVGYASAATGTPYWCVILAKPAPGN